MNLMRICAAALAALTLFACSGGGDDDDESPTPDAETRNQDSNAGAYAYDFLTNDTYTDLVIEIDYMEDSNPNDNQDSAPSDEAKEALLNMLTRFCNKGFITIDDSLTDVIPVPIDGDGNPKTEYSYDEINDLEVQYRDRYRSGSEAVMYFLYVNGTLIDDNGDVTGVVGFAHHGSSMAVFKGFINEYIVLPPSRAYYERTVVVHEVGHLLGLVDNGIDAVADHVDNDPNAGRGVHCTNEDCMMYWQVASSDFLQQIISGVERDFDQDCQDDIVNAGGKDGSE